MLIKDCLVRVISILILLTSLTINRWKCNQMIKALCLLEFANMSIIYSTTGLTVIAIALLSMEFIFLVSGYFDIFTRFNFKSNGNNAIILIAGFCLMSAMRKLNMDYTDWIFTLVFSAAVTSIQSSIAQLKFKLILE